MVSKASEDLPDPDRPVNTMSESRGRSSETFLRLCSRAPRTMRRSATPVRTFLEGSDRGGAPVLFRLGGATDNAGSDSRIVNKPRLSSMPDAAPDLIARAFDFTVRFTSFTRRCDAARVGGMIDHADDLASVHAATERLLHAVGALDNAAVTQSSRLPGLSLIHI